MALTTILLIGLAVVALVALLAWQQRRGLGGPSDAECIDIFREDGIDLTRPRMIDFHVHFPSRERAVAAQSAIEAVGYRVSVGGGPGSPQVILCASKEMLPAQASLAAVRKELGSLTRPFDGRFQGCMPRSRRFAE